MLAFVDESYQGVDESNTVFYTTHAAACLPRSRSREFSRELFNLKRAFWRIDEPTDKEIKGSLLLSVRSLEKPKNREFVSNIMALMRQMDFRVFASVQKGPLGTFKGRDKLQRPFQFFLERINRYTETTDDTAAAILIYDSIEDKANRVIAESVTNFRFRHGMGKDLASLLEFPAFGDSRTTPGLQIADLVAYCVNARWAGRRGRLEAIYQELAAMSENWTDPSGQTNYGIRYMDLTGA